MSLKDWELVAVSGPTTTRYETADGAGNASTASATCTVPRDQRK